MYDSITQKERKREVLSKFKGVDAASPVYAVDKARATAMRNFIAENGSNHKRPGWRQFARFKDPSGRDQAINGYFRIVLSNQEYRIVYAGTTFYIFDDATNSFISFAEMYHNYYSDIVPDNVYNPSLLVDRPVQMFVNKNKAYFIGCGDFLVFEIKNGKPELRRVYDDINTYIPRTTTNIGPMESEVDGNSQPIEYAERQTDRDVNLMTRCRYNELIGSAQASSVDIENPELRTYQLDDTNLDPDVFEMNCYDYDNGTKTTYTTRCSAFATDRRAIQNGDILNNQELQINSAQWSSIPSDCVPEWDRGRRSIVRFGENTISIEKVNSTRITLLFNSTTICVGTRSSILSNSYTLEWRQTTFTGCSGRILIDIYAFREYFTAILPVSYKVIEASSDNSTWIECGRFYFKEGKVSLKMPFRPIEGEANICVKIAKTSVKTNDILRCTFGTYFGVNGNTNTLFLSGNEDARNVDYWSEAEDFTYFPSGNCCDVGTENTAIMGYLRLGDDSLAIIKEESRHEPTLYIRSGVAPSVDASTNTVTEGYYYTRGKFITQGAVSQNAFGTLSGDPLFLSKQGVYGIVMTDNVAVEERVARERSRFINPLLAKHRDLSKATAIVYDNRYYLAIDGAVYVADARYTHTARGDMPDTYNYEWWVWDNCPVRQWYEIDGELCFGTADGRLCVFDGEFTDRKQNDLGAHTVDPTNNRIAFGTTYDTLAEGDLCRIDGNAYRVFIAAATVSSGKISFPETMLGYIHTGTVVYADAVGASGLSVDTKYIIDSIDAAELQFTIATEQGAAVTPASGDFRLLCHIGGEILKVHLEEGYLQIKNERTDELYTLAVYNSTAWSTKLYKYYRNNVVAEWYSPVLDMGANDYVKTLQRLTIATEQITNGRITFGWETKSASTLVDVDAKGLDVFDFGNLNFARFAFDTGFSSSFTRDVKADFNFILFRFISDNDCDCCVYSFTVTYKVNRRNKGVF